MALSDNQNQRIIRDSGALFDAQLDGAMVDIVSFAEHNRAYLSELHAGSWHKNNDGTYSKAFRVELENGLRTTVISKTKINETKYFKLRLKDG